MGHAAISIPEKIFFKIGEVCDIVDVQAHVLRYWETEFPQLSPQKNRSGQRSYRRRDVEIALRIKELLYEDEYTIAGARKKLQHELRESTRLKIVPNEPAGDDHPGAAVPELDVADIGDIGEIDPLPEPIVPIYVKPEPVRISTDRQQALTEIAAQLLELREMLKSRPTDDREVRRRTY